MLFQGEEWAASTPFQYFTDHEDKELAKLVSEGRKKEFAAFGWTLKIFQILRISRHLITQSLSGRNLPRQSTPIC
jgi:1,4-alpha-glucan branching enzyme